MKDRILYYLSIGDTNDPGLRLYIPKNLEQLVKHQKHNALGHMAFVKTHDTSAI